MTHVSEAKEGPIYGNDEPGVPLMANTIPHSAVAQAKKRRAEVERVLIEAGTEGLAVLDIVKRLPEKHPVSTVLNWLRDLAAEGRCERNNNGGPACRWGPPGTHAAWKERRKHADRLRKARNAKKAREADADISDVPVQSVIRAGTKPPPVTTAVRSIFEVAA